MAVINDSKKKKSSAEHSSKNVNHVLFLKLGPNLNCDSKNNL